MKYYILYNISPLERDTSVHYNEYRDFQKQNS